MADDPVLVDRRDRGVALLTLNRPPMNPLDVALLDALAAAVVGLHADPSVRAVVLTGSDRAFAAGADVKAFELTEDGARRVSLAFRAAAGALEAMPRPVIAAINGYALGGGLELALACDLRVAGHTARVGQPEILLGIIPGGGGTQRLARLVGPARAKEIIWSGRQIGADEAHALGIVDEVAPADEVVERALARAAHFAEGAVDAMGIAKRVIDRGLGRPLAEGLDLETDGFAEAFLGAEATIGVRSFLEHGPGQAHFLV